MTTNPWTRTYVGTKPVWRSGARSVAADHTAIMAVLGRGRSVYCQSEVDLLAALHQADPDERAVMFDAWFSHLSARLDAELAVVEAIRDPEPLEMT